eukprot:scaffold112247_cov30-Tisochrysis_lutea.AAC.1
MGRSLVGASRGRQSFLVVAVALGVRNTSDVGARGLLADGQWSSIETHEFTLISRGLCSRSVVWVALLLCLLQRQTTNELGKRKEERGAQSNLQFATSFISII